MLDTIAAAGKAAPPPQTSRSAGGSPPANGLPPLPPIPDSFRDPQGNVRVAALWQAFVSLQNQMTQFQQPANMTPATGTPANSPPQNGPQNGPPDSPDGYCIDCGHGLFQPDAEINSRLHQAGYSPEQAQLLYDLAAEKMLPLLQSMAGDLQAESETRRLTDHFGGADKWRQISRQLQAWGNNNLPSDAVSALATTFDGVMALFRMMQGGEPATLKGPASPGGPSSEAELYALMRDPRYWRDRQDSVVAQVTDGFRRLYPGN